MLDNLVASRGKQIGCLIHDISLKVAVPSAPVVVGPSGCGKRPSLRLISGLWPAQAARFVGRRSPNCCQAPRSPTQSSAAARTALCYPTGSWAFISVMSTPQSWLEDVCLPDLVAAHIPNLDHHQDWQPQSSRWGEAAAVWLSRLLLNSHRASWCSTRPPAHWNVTTEKHLYYLAHRRNESPL